VQALPILERYNRKAEILNRRSFLAAIRQGKGTFKISGMAGQGAVITYDLPNEEELHAFLLTARLFDQDCDGLSFKRMVELYRHLEVPEALRVEVAQIAPDLELRAGATRLERAAERKLFAGTSLMARS
jgi:hypothetical protein